MSLYIPIWEYVKLILLTSASLTEFSVPDDFLLVPTLESFPPREVPLDHSRKCPAFDPERTKWSTREPWDAAAEAGHTWAPRFRNGSGPALTKPVRTPPGRKSKPSFESSRLIAGSAWPILGITSGTRGNPRVQLNGAANSAHGRPPDSYLCIPWRTLRCRFPASQGTFPRLATLPLVEASRHHSCKMHSQLSF
jgi:hypothetical protein